MSTKNNQTSLTPGSKEYLEALAESQGEIKQLSPFDSWVLQSRKREEALEWAQKHPKRDKFRHFIPVINSWWTSTKADPAYPSQRKAIAQSVVSDVMALTGLGKVAQVAGIAPAITTEALASAGAYGGNELGEHLVETGKISPEAGIYVVPGLTWLGGSLGAGTAFKTYRGWQRALEPDIPVVKQEYNNWGGEFVDDVNVRSYNPIRPSGQDTSFKTAKYAGSPGTYNGKTVPAWQLPKGQRNQDVYVRSPEQQFVSDYLEYRGKPYELKGNWTNWEIIEHHPETHNLMDSFIKSLPEPDPKFLVDDRIIFGYRNYLRTHGVEEFRFSDANLQKLLSHEYKTLSNSATGKLKNTLLFHSSPEWFDSFDLRYTGKNMENSGTLGPGNYFSIEGTLYGRTPHELFDRQYYSMNNTQPYIITGITSTPNGRVMQNKGMLPEIIHKYRVRDHFGGRYNLDPEFSTKLQQQISKTPLHDNRAYVAPSTSNGIPWLYKQGVFRYGESMPLFGGEVMIRRNSGIKSLYPHPSRFVKNADGTVTLKPVDWSDPRVNYKDGGIINE